MVGVPRSTGCATCVQRHVKCDETRPTCLRCQRVGRACPGYERRLIFKNSVPKTRARNGETHRKGRPSPASRSSSTRSTPSDLSDQSDQPYLPDQADRANQTDGSLVPHSSHHVEPQDQFSMIRIASPAAEQVQMGNSFISAFVFTRPNKRNPQVKLWLGNVYNRMGTSAPLDYALRSLCCLQCGVRTRDTRLVYSAQSSYVNALRSVRHALEHNDPSSHSDIHSAVMLLTYYELMSNKQENTWIRHSGGAAQIMKVRGPQAYTSGYDFAMYMVCRYWIVIQAYVTNNACFLEDPAWDITHKISFPFPVASQIQEDMFVAHVKAPRIVRDGRNAIEGGYDNPDVVVRARELRVVMKQLFSQWMTELDKGGFGMEEVDSQDPLFPRVYRGPDMITIGYFCSHYSTLALLNTLMITLGAEERASLLTENEFVAKEVCKCMEHMRHSILGSLYLPFWLQGIKHAAPSQFQGWIEEQIACMRGGVQPI